MVNNVVICGRLRDPLGNGEHIYIWFPSTITVLLINKTKFLDSCHALKNSVAVKGLSILKI